MQFKIKNIGKIISADIKLNGLTVIAGANDSGKSTAGRALYSLVTAYKNTQGFTPDVRQSLLFRTAEQFYIRYRTFIERLSLPDTISGFIKLYEKSESELLDRIKISIEEVSRMDDTPRRQSILNSHLYKMVKILERNDAKQIMTEEMNSVLYSEFYGKYQRIGTDSSMLAVEDSTGYLIVNLTEKAVEGYSSNEEFSLFSDATYIESPLYLHVLTDLYYKSSFMQSDYRYGDVPAHVIDFATKIRGFRYSGMPNEIEDDTMSILLNEVFDTVAGTFERSEEKDVLTWKDKNGNEFSTINIASGIKSFGLLQILIQSRDIQADKLLIWDEPENHLHPEWQIKIADLMVRLSKAGVPIVVSSHSPYFIQAIRYSASKHGIEKYVNYYLTEDNSVFNGVTLDDVTDDLNRLFVKLAEPLNRIMNI